MEEKSQVKVEKTKEDSFFQLMFYWRKEIDYTPVTSSKLIVAHSIFTSFPSVLLKN